MLFLAVFPLLLYGCYRRPFIAVGLCVWVALFYPSGWMYGAAQGIRYNLIFALLAIWGVIRQKNSQNFRISTLSVLVLFFFAWTTISSILSVGPSEVVWEHWTRLFKIVILYFLVLLGVRRRLHVEFIFWCLLLSIGTFAVIEGLKYISSGGAHVLQGLPGHVLGDRNELSIAMVMTIPLVAFFLADVSRGQVVLKAYLVSVLVLLIVSVLGSNSRGGFLALSCLGVYFFLQSRHKLLVSCFSLLMGWMVLSYMPDSWFQRMDTINDATSDGSFLGRLMAWKMNYVMALDRPLFGGGFKSVENLQVWQSLVSKFYQTNFFGLDYIELTPNSSKAAHSIYFQVLGEHGFVGLMLFMGLLVVAFLKLGRLRKLASKYVELSWVSSCSVTLRLILFAYAVGGAALSFAYFDFVYVVLALVVVLERILDEYFASDGQRSFDGN
ncbi:putative O-glycosylation ligase, exosortase A system-associated [Paucibacter sp. AS339]|uniref:putative O-glycosylation ligase, exosortase A system-associated n=1 Tax=Paucibacter hankyongi TaxID=3133434 RepID=UPI0030AF5F49